MSANMSANPIFLLILLSIKLTMLETIKAYSSKSLD
jgi:hypothetical protein